MTNIFQGTRQIIEALENKGWTLYDGDLLTALRDGDRRTIDSIVGYWPADLSKHNEYFQVIPLSENPNDTDKVIGEIENARKTNQFPYLVQLNFITILEALIFHQDGVTMLFDGQDWGHRSATFSYQDALETLKAPETQFPHLRSITPYDRTIRRKEDNPNWYLLDHFLHGITTDKEYCKWLIS